MRPGRHILMVMAACAMLMSLSESVFAGPTADEAADSMSTKVQDVLARADGLVIQRGERSRQYLQSLSDEGLAQLYARATSPQQVQPGSDAIREADALERIKKDRQPLIEDLLKWGSPLGEDEDKAFRDLQAGLADELAALGPGAVSALCTGISVPEQRIRHWALARKALLKMGLGAVAVLIPWTDCNDPQLAEGAAEVLSLLADRSAMDDLLRALDHGSGGVRVHALEALIRLGPEVVGEAKLRAILLDRLEDGACIGAAIHGLEQYGDGTTLEPLRVIERFSPLRKAIKGGGWSRPAARAVNAILKRAGKPFAEVSVEQVTQRDSTYDELCAAARCTNAVIRSDGIIQLERFRDDCTVRFLCERLREERNPSVLLQTMRSLFMLTLQSQGTSEPGASAAAVQEAFDALVTMAQTCVEEADPEAAVIDAARTVLHAASRRQLVLEGTERYKVLVLTGLGSPAEVVRAACYHGCTAIALAGPAAGGGWTASEKRHIQDQLSPLLSSTRPPLRLIECLGYVGDRRLVPRLIELLAHTDGPIRMFAASALGWIGDPGAVPMLRHVAQTDPLRYENGVYGVREAARQAIGEIRKAGPEGTAAATPN